MLAAALDSRRCTGTLRDLHRRPLLTAGVLTEAAKRRMCTPEGQSKTSSMRKKPHADKRELMNCRSREKRPGKRVKSSAQTRETAAEKLRQAVAAPCGVTLDRA